MSDNMDKKAGMESPSKDFTAQLMQQIEAEERALSSLISNHGKLETSDAFLAGVMEQLEGKSVARPYRPVIPKAVWAGIAAVFTGLALFLSFSGQTGSDSSLDKRYDSVLESFNAFFAGSGFLHYILIPTTAVALILLLDLGFRKKRGMS